MSLLALITLVFTIVLEFVVYIIIIKGKKWWVLLAYSVLINATTQPVALAIFQNTEISWWLLETSVTLIEGVLLALLLEIRFPRTLQISLLANFVSAVLGLALFSNI